MVRESADNSGDFVLAERYPKLFAVCRRKDLCRNSLVGVEGKELGLETHHVGLFAVDKNL